MKPLNMNIVYNFLYWNRSPCVVFFWIAAQHIYAESAFLQSLGGVEGQLGGGDVLGMEELTQKQYVFFWFYVG